MTFYMLKNYFYCRAAFQELIDSQPNLFIGNFKFGIETMVFPLRACVGMTDRNRQRGTGRDNGIFQQAAIFSDYFIHPGAGVFYFRPFGRNLVWHIMGILSVSCGGILRHPTRGDKNL